MGNRLDMDGHCDTGDGSHFLVVRHGILLAKPTDNKIRQVKTPLEVVTQASKTAAYKKKKKKKKQKTTSKEVQLDD